MTTPCVSVIVPCHNSAATVGAAVNSALSQSIENLELIVIDDGSSDATTECVEKAAGGDPRLRLMSQANCGVSFTRNRGVREARGRFVAFLDADDLWSADKLALHLDHLRSDPGVGVSFGRVQYLDPTGRPLARVSPTTRRSLGPADLLTGNRTITTSNLVVRRELFAQAGGFDERMSFAEDLEWLTRVLCTTNWSITGIDAIVVGYRTSPGGLSSRIERMEEGWETMIEKVRVFAPVLVARRYRAAKARQLGYLARQILRTRRDLVGAARYLLRAGLTHPGVVVGQLAHALWSKLGRHPATASTDFGRVS
jgi:glycosyltransferase involved in cell wall biosynthesis